MFTMYTENHPFRCDAKDLNYIVVGVIFGGVLVAVAGVFVAVAVAFAVAVAVAVTVTVAVAVAVAVSFRQYSTIVVD